MQSKTKLVSAILFLVFLVPSFSSSVLAQLSPTPVTSPVTSPITPPTTITPTPTQPVTPPVTPPIITPTPTQTPVTPPTPTDYIWYFTATVACSNPAQAPAEQPTRLVSTFYPTTSTNAPYGPQWNYENFKTGVHQASVIRGGYSYGNGYIYMETATGSALPLISASPASLFTIGGYFGLPANTIAKWSYYTTNTIGPHLTFAAPASWCVTPTPTPTRKPTYIPTPTSSPTPTRKPTSTPTPKPIQVCHTEYRVVRIGTRTITIPYQVCIPSR